MIRFPVSLSVCLLLLAAGASASGQTVDDVFPLEPEDRAVVGPKPRLRVGVDGSEITKMRFRIEMSRDGFDTIEHTFDQREDPQGWGFMWVGFDQPGAMFNVRKPLENGVYEWRASVWNGIEWIDGDEEFELTVDSIPPVDVGELRMDINRDSGMVILEWDPVLFDAEGGVEEILQYHVYRYPRLRTFPIMRPNWIGSVPGTRFVDEDPDLDHFTILSYQVVAEDRAGNITGMYVPKPRKPVHRVGPHRREVEQPPD
jgi:hypothetical protein